LRTEPELKRNRPLKTEACASQSRVADYRSDQRCLSPSVQTPKEYPFPESVLAFGGRCRLKYLGG
jgi:hypothetical protein